MNEGSGLNPAQTEAVNHKEGPLLVLAGAGAGKTRVIAHRIENLIGKGVPPNKILAVTFTNKAAREMRERVSALLGKRHATGFFYTDRPFVATFHALGAWVLRENTRALGLTRSFSIFDRGDSLRAIKDAMERAGISPKEFEPRKILGTISRQKGDATNQRTYEEGAHEFYPKLVASIWKHYDAILKEERALDFDDLLLSTLTLLQSSERVRGHYQSAWQYIHIDEYQDTNKVQSELARILAAPENNICAVGDLDQNIYTWRGASIEHILSFERTFPNTRVILLEQNYRSTKTIIDASNTVIAKNKNRVPKQLFTDNNTGEKITLAGLYDETEEARFVAQEALRNIEGGTPPSEIAVLYRANFQSRALEEAFLEYNIPYQVLGIRFFERREVKDVLSFLRAALNPESLGDLKRIINVPPRGIGKVTFLAMASGREHTLPARTQKNVATFRNLLQKIKARIETETPAQTVRFILKESGLEEKLKGGTEDDLERLENMRELAALAARYDASVTGLAPREGVEKLLEDAALASDQDELKEDREAVRLMTVHAGKGLEFDTVFVTGLEEGLFPHESLSEERVDEEEERRLFYVALTRAKRKLFLTYASVRTIFGSRGVNVPSEFIGDIDESLIEVYNPEAGKVIYID
jgi:DNA helicase-2/ATP-dependent DNA helicase PcrA